MTCNFTSVATVFQLYQDNGRLCAMKARLRLGRFRLEQGSNSVPGDQQASATAASVWQVNQTALKASLFRDFSCH